MIGDTYTQDRLSREADIYPSDMSNYLTGKTEPSKKSIDKIAHAFDLTMAQFYAGPDALIESQPEPPQEDTMQDISQRDLLRAKVMGLICEMPDEDVREVIGYLNGIAARHKPHSGGKINGAAS